MKRLSRAGNQQKSRLIELDNSSVFEISILRSDSVSKLEDLLRDFAFDVIVGGTP